MHHIMPHFLSPRDVDDVRSVTWAVEAERVMRNKEELLTEAWRVIADTD